MLYGWETRTVNQEILELDRVDGCFTRPLRIAHNVDWTVRICNTQIYSNGIFLPATCITAKRTMKLLAVLWEPWISQSRTCYCGSQIQVLWSCHFYYTGAAKQDSKGVMSEWQQGRHIWNESNQSERWWWLLLWIWWMFLHLHFCDMLLLFSIL